MHRGLLIAFVVVGLVFSASAGIMLALWKSSDRPAGWGAAGGAIQIGTSIKRSTDPLVPDPHTSQLTFPPFELTDQDGRTITRDVFTGKITIVDFFFTHCNLVCPLLVQRMADQAAALKNTPIRLLSISVDPVHDTPERIKQYGTDHGVDFSRWTFARGDKETIGNIVTGGLQFAVGEDPTRTIPLGDGKTMPNIVHPPWFALVGPKGDVLGIYDATMEDEMTELTQRARGAAAKLKN